MKIKFNTRLAMREVYYPLGNFLISIMKLKNGIVTKEEA